MRDAGRRPLGRLCYWMLALITTFGLELSARGAAPVPQSGPSMTTIADTVYLADGSTAQGSLIITWPAFMAASGSAVAAGSTNTTLGANGALNVELAANAGATPAGVYYTVVYQVGPGEVRTEYWIVPASTSAVNLAEVRATPGSGVAAQPVSMQYVNSELATKANDNAVVHLNGSEAIAGTKSFATPPTVPPPVNSGDIANKAYVDQSVSNVGAGSYLPTAGGAMTGPITLPANPAAPMQASTKQYVDTGLAAKADLISGLVPATELGTGAANAGSCLLGNGTWGACGSGGGSGNVSTNPAASQVIAQPAGTQFSTNNLANIRYVTPSWNWSQTPADNLATPGTLTIHLSPCPLGIDTASSSNYYSYRVYISGTGTAEAAPVIGGSCAPGTSSGTITVTTAYAHAAGYTVSSASSGIQEAWNDAWTNDTGVGMAAQTGPYVKLSADQQYNVYSSIYLRGRGGVLDGAGALIVCSTRDRCIFVGTTQGYPYVNHHKIYNLSGASTLNVDGVQVASVSAASGIYTITTATAHPFVVGDTVDCEEHSQTSDGHWSTPVLSVPNSTSFTISLGKATVAAGTTTFGFCNLLNTFIENNSDHVALQDINLFQSNPAAYGFFSYGIVNDNDQQFIVERASNRSSLAIKTSANWPIGAFLYQRTDQGNQGITYLHDSEITGVNCVTGGGNGLVVTDSVCQGFPMYGIRYFGGYQPATFQNIYEESTGGTVNPLYGYAAQGGYLVQGGMGTRIVGTFPVSGYSPVFAQGGGGAAERTYFVVPRSSTLGYGPVLFIGSAEPASGSTSITLAWPSIELENTIAQSVGTLTWDVLVTTGGYAQVPMGTGNYAIATNIAASCGTNGMCSFVDTQAAATSYTVAAQQFTPVFWFWPLNLAINNTVVLTDQIGADPQAVATQGTLGVSIVAEQCRSEGTSWRRSPIWVSCLTGENGGGSGSFATLLQEQDTANNGPAANSKGRLNFGKPIVQPNDVITLQDSNFTKTVTAAGERPSNDAGDMALGVDQAGGLAERAATSISEYINELPSGANYQERLTASAKTFNVPVTVNGNFTVPTGTVTLPVTGTGSQCLHVSSTGVLSGTGADCGSGSGSVTVNSGVTTQVAMYSGNGTAVSGDGTLTDNGTTLSYTGSGGISGASGTFSGNLTVNGQLMVAGPWMVSSPIPGTAMAAAGTGTSALGISNDGNFYISTNGGSPQKVATAATSSDFLNLNQEDTYDVGQYVMGETTSNPQALHVYSSYTNSSTWQRTSLGFDGSDGYAVVKSENSAAGQAPGLGFWINSGLKWVIDAGSTLKPWADEAYNIGTFNPSTGVALRPATIYAAGTTASNSGFELGKFANNSYELCNDATNGTAINGLAMLTGNGCAVKPASAATSGIIGVVIANAGTSGTTTLVRTGSAYCNFDATATVVGDYVVPSATANGGAYSLCHDAGAVQPTGVQVLGRVLQATGGGTTAQMFFDMPGSSAAAPYSGSALPWVMPQKCSAGSLGTVTSSAKAYVFGVTLTYPLSTSKLVYDVTNADNNSGTGHNYDIAIYQGMPSATDNRIVHLGETAGTTFAPSTGWKTLAWSEGATTLPPGRYYVMFTSDCTAGGTSCAEIADDSSTLMFYFSGSSGVGIAAGGQTPSTYSSVTDSPSASTVPCFLIE